MSLTGLLVSRTAEPTAAETDEVAAPRPEEEEHFDPIREVSVDAQSFLALGADMPDSAEWQPEKAGKRLRSEDHEALGVVQWARSPGSSPARVTRPLKVGRVVSTRMVVTPSKPPAAAEVAADATALSVDDKQDEKQDTLSETAVTPLAVPRTPFNSPIASLAGLGATLWDMLAPPTELTADSQQ